MRIRSKSGKYIAIIPAGLIGGFSVVVTANGVSQLVRSWPGCNLHRHPVRFEFSASGDLVDMVGNQPDGEALLALSYDAQQFGEACIQKRLAAKK